ncbi:TPM domain-containing protein [Psychromonas aquimarina]|uniref:TPM domain-containing protein n=1 Tax=Psychromonas aquimarina TaxID=444919 RepID=UPI00041C4F7C|nr:TPM domain-containing protein [Psychromonas aquimarina]
MLLRPLFRSLLLCCSLFLSACLFAGEIVTDKVNLLNTGESAILVSYHNALLASHDIDMRIVITDAQEIDKAAELLFSELDAGELSDKEQGLLFVINPYSKLLRLKTAPALNSLYGAGFTVYLQQYHMVPFFSEGNITEGITAGVELIVKQALRPDHTAWLKYQKTDSLGAGSEIQNSEVSVQEKRVSTYSQENTPQVILNRYFKVLKSHNNSTALGIYSSATRGMLQQWTVTAAQMDNVLKTYKNCPDAQLVKADNNSYAVLRYPIDARLCSPWFFINEDGWKLDLTMTEKSIRFNHNNNWYFDMSADHNYWFAFLDWNINRTGFPTGQVRWGLGVEDIDKKVQVTYVLEGMPFAALDIRKGDQIVSINGEKVSTKESFFNLLNALRDESGYEFLIKRDGRLKLIKGQLSAD